MRRFDGWEPAQTTVHEYGDDGRQVRSTTTTEPEWDDEQAGWMLALGMYRAGLCPSCGLPREECMARENDGRYRVTAMRCHPTTARLIAAERYRQNPQAEALLYAVEKT